MLSIVDLYIWASHGSALYSGSLHLVCRVTRTHMGEEDMNVKNQARKTKAIAKKGLKLKQLPKVRPLCGVSFSR
jgi:hypothetical protein